MCLSGEHAISAEGRNRLKRHLFGNAAVTSRREAAIPACRAKMSKSHGKVGSVRLGLDTFTCFDPDTPLKFLPAACTRSASAHADYNWQPALTVTGIGSLIMSHLPPRWAAATSSLGRWPTHSVEKPESSFGGKSLRDSIAIRKPSQTDARSREE